MTQEIENTHADSEQDQTVTTDTAVDTETSETDSGSTPKVEQRDGKLYVDGVRVYSREDTNRIAANSRKEIESRILEDLGVDSLESVKQVIGTLQESSGTQDLNVESLRDAVKKREATVEELRAELEQVRTESTMREHLGKLNLAMPSEWTDTQRQAVVDLMKARDMFQLEGDQFAIRLGDGFITDQSGEAPDYAEAVRIMGDTLGLPSTKRGVKNYQTPDAETSESKAKRGLDADRLKSDAAYRNAYVQLRNRNRGLMHSDITDAQVRKQMEGSSRGDSQSRMLSNSAQPSKRKTRR